MSKTRLSQCCCGQLRLEVAGDPKQVLACSCDFCQRRTGAIMQHSAWFSGDQIVSVSGDKKEYRSPRNADLVGYYFCPHCGSTLYWKMDGFSKLYGRDMYGFAVGNFADPDFPQPRVECWSSKRHRWQAPASTDLIFETFPETWPPLI